MIKAFFKNLGEYTIILGMKNGFVMIKKFQKSVGNIYKIKLLTNENKKIIMNLQIKNEVFY